MTTLDVLSLVDLQDATTIFFLTAILLERHCFPFRRRPEKMTLYF